MILLSEIQQQQKSFISWHTSESHSHKVICLIEVQISFIHDSAGQCFNDNHDQKKRRSKVLKSYRETCYISLETRNKTMPTPQKKQSESTILITLSREECLEYKHFFYWFHLTCIFRQDFTHIQRETTFILFTCKCCVLQIRPQC